MKCYWFVFCKTDIVLEKTADGYTIPLSEHCPTPLKAWSQVLDIDPMPDISTKEKAQRYIGLDPEKLNNRKQKFLKTVVPKWLEEAKAKGKLVAMK